MSFTPEQLRALGRTASPPEPLPEQRPYSYERAVELLEQTAAMLAHRTRELAVATPRVNEHRQCLIVRIGGRDFEVDLAALRPTSQRPSR